MAEEKGLAPTIFLPVAGIIRTIDPDLLAAAVAVEIDGPCLIFADDIGALQDDTYLDRLSVCIDSIVHSRPDPRFVITLQVERLQVIPALEAWVVRHGFHRILVPDLSSDERRSLAESGTQALNAALTPEAVATLGNDEAITRPWDIVRVLEAALDRTADELPLTESDVRALLAEGEQTVWARQRQAIEEAEPATRQLLESIGHFFAAGVTPRQSSILRYAASRMPATMKPDEKRSHLDVATKNLKQYDVVANDGLFGIPEPRLLPLIAEIGTEQAHLLLKAFMATYNPGRWTSLAVRLLRPFDFIFRPRYRSPAQSTTGAKVRAALRDVRSRLPSLHLNRWRATRGMWERMVTLLKSVYAWPADRALLASELGSSASVPSYLSSNVIRERGRLALEAGQYRRALDELTMAIALNPTNSAAIAFRGETYRKMRKPDQALADFTNAIALDPKYAWAIAHRGGHLSRDGALRRCPG